MLPDPQHLLAAAVVVVVESAGAVVAAVMLLQWHYDELHAAAADAVVAVGETPPEKPET